MAWVAAEGFSQTTRRAEVGARDLCVRLEPRDAFAGPVADHALRVGGVLERMHRARPGAIALQVRAGHDDARPGNQQRVDLPFEIQLLI